MVDSRNWPGIACSDLVISPMKVALTQINLSARAYDRIRKLARTIADLAGSEEIGPVHLAEALQYKPKLVPE